MSETWIVIVAVGTMTVALKAVGPVLLGGKPLPEHLTGIVGLLAPALLAALVVTQVLGGDEEIVLDARLVGLAAAVVALLLRSASSRRRDRRSSLHRGRSAVHLAGLTVLLDSLARGLQWLRPASATLGSSRADRIDQLFSPSRRGSAWIPSTPREVPVGKLRSS